jgi:DNA-binding helix-hairpin-helix protein with protein kinase domain
MTVVEADAFPLTEGVTNVASNVVGTEGQEVQVEARQAVVNSPPPPVRAQRSWGPVIPPYLPVPMGHYLRSASHGVIES